MRPISENVGSSLHIHLSLSPRWWQFLRPLQLIYMFLVRRPPRTRPPSVNTLCIARMTCGAIPNWTTLYCACAVADSHELQAKMVDWQSERTYLSASVKRGRNLSYFVGRLAALFFLFQVIFSRSFSVICGILVYKQSLSCATIVCLVHLQLLGC